MVKDYAEQILKSVEIVVGKCLNDIQYDKTEICIVLNDEDKKNGHYKVSNGSTKYDAFVDTSHNANAIPEYKVNDSVRVSIPNGDYSQKKYIQGLNITDNDTCPITYISPMDTLLDMTDNIISKENIRGLRANDENQSEWCIWSADCTQPDYRHLQNNSLYDTIAIKGDFKTLLTGYNVNSGSYGLRLDMYFKPTNGTDKLIKYSAYLDSTDMYGNPYSFLIYSTQAIKFSIANIGAIQTISLYFYQKNNFTYLTDNGKQEFLPVLNAQDPDYSNLLLKNVYLSFGSDISNIDDNVIKLYTNEPLEYDRLSDEESINTKGIGLLWYNKDDNGKYLGFSDGIYDKEYDEIEYLELSEGDSRLLSQQGKDVPLDEAGLDLSADIVEAEILLNRLRNSITQDLYQMIHSFRARIEGICNDTKNNTIEKDYFNTLLNSSTGSIAAAGKQLEEDTKKIVEYYLAKLSNARAKQDEKEYTPTELTYTSIEDMMKGPKKVLNDTQELLDYAKAIISNTYSGFMSVYDSFNTKLTKLMEITDDYISTFTELMKDNQNKLDNFFKDDYEFKAYQTKIDEKIYSNRYCIYWYRYVPGYSDPTERFMEQGWQRLIKEKDFNRLSDKEDIVKNYGLPKAELVIDNIKYYDKRPALGEDIITRVMDINSPEEKYCIIIFYNHTMYKSEPLVFTNLNPPQDASASDQNGALYIEHLKNSRDTYQSYGVNNFLVNAADAYNTRYLMARYEGLLGGNEQLIDGQIFWYIPLNATMLTYDLNDYGTDFTNDKYDAVDSPTKLEGYIGFYRQIKAYEDKPEDVNEECLKFPYHIKDYYVSTSTNNDIICKVITKDNRTLEAAIPFIFASYGTSGTDYTLTISPSGFQTAFKQDSNLLLDVKLFDYNNELVSGVDPNKIEMQFIGPSVKPYLVTWSDGLQCTVSANTDKNPLNGYYYGVLKADMEFEIPEIKNESGEITQPGRVVNLSSFYSVPYINIANLYQDAYIEGPAVVVYDSSGSNPTYYKNPYKIYSNDINKYKDKEITDVKWRIAYYTDKGEDYDKLNATDRKKYQLLMNWMPKLSNDNKLIPSNMFLKREATDMDSTDLFPVAICYQETEDGKEIVIYTQPIYLMQNRYASAMLNAWDGSLEIDEENGTILASMVGAGRKTSNNTFEGVLMGDVGGTVSGDNATGIGLYGYHDGAQSFHFGIDGTAFLGKSGRGRLLFDGNNSTIQSASYLNNGKGMMIDFDDGVIDIVGSESSQIIIQETSPYLNIKSNNGKDLIYIGNDNYYLQTNDYVQNISGTKINLTTGQIDSYNFYLTADSGNIIFSSFSPYLKIHDMIYMGNDAYYLQSPGYNGSNGTKIDLMNGSITSYNFKLSAGSTSTGAVILDSNPSTGTDYYLYVGKNSGSGLISLNKNGILSIKASDFTLNTSNNDIFISDKNTSILMTINGSSFYPLLKIGDNFGVSSNGTVYASNIQATGGKIGGWNIDTEKLYYGSKNSPTASINGKNGTMTFGVSTSKDSYFNVTDAGLVTATGADLKKLTVREEAIFTDTCAITVDGNMIINKDKKAPYALQLNGDTLVEGNIYMGYGTNKGDIVSNNAKNNRISFNDGIWLYGDKTGLFSSSVQIGYQDGTESGGQDLSAKSNVYLQGTTYLNGVAYVQGSLHYKSSIYTYHPTTDVQYIGKTGTYQTANLFGGKIKLSFINGIMVGSTKDGTEVDDLEAETLPSISGQDGKILRVVNGSLSWVDTGDLAWADDIKKNFDITASGSYGQTLYVHSGSHWESEIVDYTPIEDPVTGNITGFTPVYGNGHWVDDYSGIGSSISISGSASATFGPGTSTSISLSISGTPSIS